MHAKKTAYNEKELSMRRTLLYIGIIALVLSCCAYAGGSDDGWIHSITSMIQASTQYIMDLVENTNTPIVRLGVIFILGLLMSLTPCIYPMIPITLGTLQAAAGTSKQNTFVLSLLYTCGIAITFAILGLLAAFGGTQIGTLLGNPWFVIPFVIFLSYLAFSMMGLYELRIPRFLQQQTSVSRSGGAYTSAFIFGMLNGSVASPCVSPGLVMLLSIVAAQQSITLGFIYLFTFGFGLGMPLLIIGSFSNAAHIMPQAGIWMLEVKRLFGILLLSMAWYYVSNITGSIMSLVSAAGIAACIALVYLYIVAGTKSRWHVAWCILMILLSIGLSVMWAVQAIRYQEPQNVERRIWTNQYDAARQHAINTNAWVLIDFGASWCPSCKKIEKQIMHSSELNNTNVVILYVDCSNIQDTFADNMMDTFNVTDGLPSVLLVEPQEEMIAARWKGELIDMTAEEFVQTLSYYGVTKTA